MRGLGRQPHTREVAGLAPGCGWWERVAPPQTKADVPGSHLWGPQMGHFRFREAALNCLLPVLLLFQSAGLTEVGFEREESCPQVGGCPSTWG